MQDRLNIAHDNYLYETSKSLQSLMNGAVVAASVALLQDCVHCRGAYTYEMSDTY